MNVQKWNCQLVLTQSHFLNTRLSISQEPRESSGVASAKSFTPRHSLADGDIGQPDKKPRTRFLMDRVDALLGSDKFAGASGVNNDIERLCQSAQELHGEWDDGMPSTDIILVDFASDHRSRPRRKKPLKTFR
jgi:hypothetical protein